MRAVYDTPGHTRGHIVYHFAAARAAFVGDTLFALGCGRLFEGTPGQMWGSLQKILQWPDDTRIYCAHEYTQSNARFALTVEPQNRSLQARARERRAAARGGNARRCRARSARSARRIRSCGRRAATCARRSVLPARADVEVFAKTRALKDAF